jgi:hypothetical protein
LEYFILGMIMVQVLFPLMDGITAVLLAGLEALKGYFGLKVAEYNVRMRKIAMCEDDEPTMRPIGFMTEEENDDE